MAPNMIPPSRALDPKGYDFCAAPWGAWPAEALNEILGSPLARAAPGGGMEHAFEAHAQERNLLCWDRGGHQGELSLTRVKDWARTRYWGERELLIAYERPRSCAGLCWERMASQTWALPECFQRGEPGRLALDRIEQAGEWDAFIAHLSAFARSQTLRGELKEAIGEGALAPQAPRRPGL